MSATLKAQLTMTVPEAARCLGIGRNQGYEAARRGDIPVLRIGKRLLVPVAALQAILEDPARRQPAQAKA